ncbi:hypothetical protein CBS101457_002585 [Exobasidium rhododendri]|nr:hypothetical protein CBS101457_002585 [Exobasidium rhododendri]
MADKDKPIPPTATESLVDFSKLPPSALDAYITYYDLAKAYPPPPPSKRRRSSRSSSSEFGGSGEEGNEEERASKRIDSSQTITTSTRLRPRSPTASMAHFFPGGPSKRNGNSEEEMTHGQGGEVNGKEEEIPCPSHFFDNQEADDYLANVASRHFANQPPPKEGEVVVQFLYRCKVGDKCLKVAN